MEEFIKETIIDGVLSAGRTIKKIEEKGFNDRSSVSDFDYGIPADKQSEQIILEAIKKSWLKCSIVSEESTEVKSDSEYKVFIDPLDGSVNFSKGIPEFCIGIGIFSKNDPVLGIIYDPNRDELFVAEKDKGITVNGNKIAADIAQENILINLEWFGAPDYCQIAIKLKENKIRARTMGCGVLALCYGAIGRGDGTILIQNRPWDIAPGMAFVKEAGIIIKQFDGTEIDLNKDKIDAIATPKEISEKIQNIVK